MNAKDRNPWREEYTIILLFALADQLTKILTLRFIPYQESIPVIPGFFNLTHLHNTGAAFSMLHDNNLFFILLSSAVFIALIVLRRHFTGLLMQWGWILLLSGIIGNVTDRIRLGHVVDFLDFQFGGYHWPAFNVADSCICIAAGLFVISGFVTPKEITSK
ncbi:MAG: signal peptidase II [Chthoniobacterales bacterium]